MSTSALEDWYMKQCDGVWEHSYGIRIDSLDNPGWMITIDLQATRRKGRTLERVKIERTATDWVEYWVEKEQFRAACGPRNLTEAIDIFVRWFESE